MKRPKKLVMPARWLAVDCETTGLYTHLGHRPFLITAVLHEKGKKDKSFLWECEEKNGKRSWPVQLWNLLADKSLPKVFHNARFDLAMLRASSFKVEGQFHDTAMTGRLHGPHKEVALKYLARKLLHVSTKDEAALKLWLKEEKARRQKAEKVLAKKEERKPVKVPSPLFSEVPREILLPYAGNDTKFTSALFELTAPKVLARCPVAYEIDRRLIRCVTDMQLRGHRLDTTYFKKLIPVCEKEYERVRRELVGKWHLPGTFNPNSPKQVKWFLTGVLGVPVAEVRDKREEESTGKEVLFRLWKKYGMTSIRWLFECRANAKAISSFCKPLLGLSDAEGVIHPQFWLGYTKTGRLSSSDPNLQNIWKDKDRLGFPLPSHLSIRRGFIPRPGFKLYYWDFSQIEAKMFAYWAREKAMMKAFEDGIDIHDATAEMMGCTRDVAKTLNYLIIYGGRAGALASQLGISREDAQVLLDTYYEKFPGVVEAMERAEEEVLSKGYATDIYGRRYYVPAEQAYKIVNYIIQGGAGNVLKCAMFHVWMLLRGRKSQMLLTIHDEIVVEIHESEEDELVPQITAVMEEQPYVERYLKTRIGVDVKLSETNWSEKHPLKEVA